MNGSFCFIMGFGDFVFVLIRSICIVNVLLVCKLIYFKWDIFIVFISILKYVFVLGLYVSEYFVFK